MARGLTERVPGTSAFLFGWADAPLQRGLAQRRKEMGWFKRTPDLQAIRPDVGLRPQTRFGLTGESEVKTVKVKMCLKEKANIRDQTHRIVSMQKETFMKSICI